jgi:uncharacterized protein YkwD
MAPPARVAHPCSSMRVAGAPGRIALAAAAALVWACAATGPAPAGAGAVTGQPEPEALPPDPPEAGPGRYGPEPRAEPDRLEAEAIRAAAGRIGGRGGRPRTSPALVLAARELARRAAGGDRDAIAPVRLRAALARALSYDASPSAYLVAAPPGEVAAALGRIVPAGGATHVGAGAAVRGGTAWVVVLAADRRARLSPFPRDVSPGDRAVLAGELAPGLLHPRVFVTLPDGNVREADASGGAYFRAAIAFPERGRYAVEVVATGPHGPEVAALLSVSSGGASLDGPRAAAEPEDPEDPAAAEARVVEALNALRRRHGLPALEADPAIAAVARRHSADMLSAGILAHVLPGGGDLPERLRRARVPFRAASENVAKGRSAAGAHGAAEESPAHRGNMLSRVTTRIGAGIARGRLASGAPVTYLTEIFVEPLADDAASPLTPETRVREALWRERARLGRPPLLADARLDDLARSAAAEMRRRDDPDPGDAGRRALDLGRRLSAVDAFVASDPSEAVRSKNLPDARFRRVGVGVSLGDGGRFGPGRLWIVVLYSD